MINASIITHLGCQFSNNSAAANALWVIDKKNNTDTYISWDIENWQWLFSFWHVLFTIKTMFWSMHHLLLTKSREILIVFWARNNSRVEATVTNIPLTFTAQIYILYSNMAATNAMIFSLGCILYSKLSRSLYKPLFHTLYWLDGGLVCCMVRGCDNSGRMPHVENQNKKKTWQI